MVAVAVTQQRLGQAVFAVECRTDVIAFDAQQPFVDFRIFVAGDRDDFAVLHADLHMAAGPAKPARSLVPVDSGSRFICQHWQ